MKSPAADSAESLEDSIESERGPCDSTIREGPSTSRMAVRLPGIERKRKRISRVIAKKNKEILRISHHYEELVNDNAKLQKKLKTSQKTVQRNKARNKSLQTPPLPEIPVATTSKAARVSTPRKCAMDDMRADGVSPSKAPKLCKVLEVQHALLKEIKVAVPRKRLITVARSPKVRSSHANKCTAKLCGISHASVYYRSKAKKSGREKKRRRVTCFYERDDNSTCLPGKKDCVAVAKGHKRQKRVLTDFLKNLYSKFKSETLDEKISYTSFKNLRPSHVLLVCYLNRQTCLCKQHQNMALLLHAAARQGVPTSKVPDDVIMTCSDVQFEAALEE